MYGISYEERDNMKKLFVIFAIMILLSGCTGNSNEPAIPEAPAPQAVQTESASPASTPEETQQPGSVHYLNNFIEVPAAGILMGEDGSVYIGVPKKLYKVTSDGEKTVFCDMSDISDVTDHTFQSPCIWDMYFDQEGNIIAAAQDRILRIDPEGKAETIFKYDFSGFCGASGIARDEEGNVYIPSGSQILKLDKDFSNEEVFIDGAKDGSHADIYSVHFSPDYKTLYISEFSNQTLVRYTIDDMGNATNREVLDIDFQELVQGSGNTSTPLDLVFDDYGNLYVSVDYTRYIAKLNKNDEVTLIDLKDRSIRIHMLTFNSDKSALYFSTYVGQLYCYIIP